MVNRDGDDVVDGGRRARAATTHPSPSAALSRGRVATRGTRQFRFSIPLRGDYAAAISIGREFASVDEGGEGKAAEGARGEEKRKRRWRPRSLSHSRPPNATELPVSVSLSVSLCFCLTSESCSCTRRRTFGQLSIPTLLERQRESRRCAAGRLSDAAGNALLVGNDDGDGDDAHCVGQRRSWPTNGRAAP